MRAAGLTVGGDSSISEREGLNWMFRATDLLFDATTMGRLQWVAGSNFLDELHRACALCHPVNG